MAWQQTLCWNCANALMGCTWSKSFEPVPGWKAIETTPGSTSGTGKHLMHSYLVIECPQFKEEK